jgi:TM2 domain-containing membrane protein YozV
MYCKNCGSEVGDSAAVCLSCGAAVAETKVEAVPVAAGSKSRSSYVLLSVLLGLIGFPGIHNIYIGDQNRGLAQLLVSVLSCWILWLPMYIWAIVEACTVTQDAEGRPLV